MREEMDAAGALEMLMPAIQPAELWEETGRWGDFGPLLLKITDRAGREFAFGPTHEEVITEFARAELRSYKQLPICFYQIQSKFRDEIRPRFGVMRAREFLMKDGYSFHINDESLAEYYQVMFDTYTAIFERLELKFKPVHADSGAIGGAVSHEFHVLADSGEDAIAHVPGGSYAANVELAEAVAVGERAEPSEDMRLVDTPEAKTIAELVDQFDLPIEKTVKTLVVEASEECEADFVALLVRGDHELNDVKAEKHPWVAAPLRMADRRRDPRRHRRRPRQPRPGRTADSLHRRPPGRRDERFQRRRQRRRQALLRHQLGPRRRTARGRRPAQRRRRRSQPGRRRHARDHPRHRGGPHLPARPQVFRSR